jgi:hypothetical protein
MKIANSMPPAIVHMTAPFTRFYTTFYVITNPDFVNIFVCR